MSSSVDSDNLSQAPSEPPKRSRDRKSRVSKPVASSQDDFSLPSTISSSEGSDDGSAPDPAPVRRRRNSEDQPSSRAPSRSQHTDDEGYDDRYYQNPPSNNNTNNGSELNLGNALLGGVLTGIGAAAGASLFSNIFAPPTRYVYEPAPSVVHSTTYRPMSRRTSIYY